MLKQITIIVASLALALAIGCDKPNQTPQGTTPSATSTASTTAQGTPGHETKAYMHTLFNRKGWDWVSTTTAGDTEIETWKQTTDDNLVTTFATVEYRDGIVIGHHTSMIANR